MYSYIERFMPLWEGCELKEFISSGSYGNVWKITCEDEQGKHYEAVKEVTIPPASVGSLKDACMQGLDIEGAKIYFKEMMKNSISEPKMMRKLSVCPNIVQFKNYKIRELKQKDEFGWVIFIRMEFLQPFVSYLINNKIHINGIAKLGIDICHALEICNKFGIVHRDIKPENLFYSPETDSFKLGDFGISHYFARPTESKGRAGTLTYMSPEIYQGDAYSPKADLYALGMIIYKLLNDNRIPLLPTYPKLFTPKQRDKALIERLQGKEIGLPSIIEHNINASHPSIIMEESSVPFAKEIGYIAQKSIASCQDERYPSAKALRRALETALNKFQN